MVASSASPSASSMEAFIPNENGDLMQYCKCTNDFLNAIIDDYFNSFKIHKDLTEGLVYEWTNSTEQIHDRYSDEEIITPTEPTWMAILIHAWENSKWNTCPTMADTPLLHLWTAPEQMTYVSNWLWDTVWRTTPLRELTPIFSLNHLDKHWMKCFQKHSKSVKISVYHLYITCISLVYHVYIMTSK